MQLWQPQEEAKKEAMDIINKTGLVYLAMEMRTGKTIISLKIAEELGAEKVLFVTKKKAIPSVLDDYRRAGLTGSFELTTINYESVHKVKDDDFDVIILDEAHEMGCYADPTNKTKEVRKLVLRQKAKPKFILMSGTPTPESYSQIYHQLWAVGGGPFSKYKGFYHWAKDYVNIRDVFIGGSIRKDYSCGKKELIANALAPLVVERMQEDMGFENTTIREEVIRVPMPEAVKEVISGIKKNEYFRFDDEREVVCGERVNKMIKIHQICSGTVKCENGEGVVVSDFKAKAIKEHSSGKKIAIFYKYVAELKALQGAFDKLTTDPKVFADHNDYVFVSQIQSGSMGVNLASADALVFMNIDFSYKLYKQARARTGHKGRVKDQVVVWFFAENGIEERILETVKRKEDYNLAKYLRDNAGIGIAEAVPKASSGFRLVCA